jgi:hypothetical protein
MQKHIRCLPAAAAAAQVVLSYLTAPTWLLGLLLDVSGGAAMLAALAAAPVSLVQPVAAFGLVLLAGFSHFVLHVGRRAGVYHTLTHLGPDRPGLPGDG